MSFAIRRADKGVSTYLSPRTGRNFGNPAGGWVNEPDKAIQFARKQDAEEFIDCFLIAQKETLHVSPV